MTASTWAIAVALLAGSIRALQLWRAASRVEVVNAVVISALAQGRGHDLGQLLANSGTSLYLNVARAITQPVTKLMTGETNSVRQQLVHDATAALVLANRRLRRHGWLDAAAVTAIAISAIAAVLDEQFSTMQSLGLVGATLLWLANVRGARSIATRMYAGGMTLVESLIDGLEQIREISEESPDSAQGR